VDGGMQCARELHACGDGNNFGKNDKAGIDMNYQNNTIHRNSLADIEFQVKWMRRMW